MGHTEPEIRDAYRETAQAIAAAKARDDFLSAREADIINALRDPLRSTLEPAYGLAEQQRVPAVTVGDDFAAWLLDREEPREIAEAMFDSGARMRLLDAYVQARAERDACVREREGCSWHDEALETLQWERAGGF
jgi:hypothetical protein